MLQALSSRTAVQNSFSNVLFEEYEVLNWKVNLNAMCYLTIRVVSVLRNYYDVPLDVTNGSRVLGLN